jgi:hypothetical protein
LEELTWVPSPPSHTATARESELSLAGSGPDRQGATPLALHSVRARSLHKSAGELPSQRLRAASERGAAAVRLFLACVRAASEGRHRGAARRCRVQPWLRACAGEWCRSGTVILFPSASSSRRRDSLRRRAADGSRKTKAGEENRIKERELPWHCSGAPSFLRRHGWLPSATGCCRHHCVGLEEGGGRGEKCARVSVEMTGASVLFGRNERMAVGSA